MNALRALHSRLLNFGTRIAHGLDGTAARCAELNQFDLLSPDEQERAAMARLRPLLQHAFSNVPYYAGVAREIGLQADEFICYDDLTKLPILTKAIIREHGARLTAQSAPSSAIKANYTGGSTGEPTTFYQDAGYRSWAQADKVRCYERCNYVYGQPLIFLWGSDYDSSAHKSVPQRLVDRLGRNLIWLNTFDLSEQLMREYSAVIAAHAPVLIVGYVASLTMYARFLKSAGLPAPRPRGIQASAEVLTSADRELLREVFGCEAFDRYGCREVGLVAHECDAHRGLHLSPLCNLCEVVDAQGVAVQPGQAGRVIATNLHNYAMPFIRYDLGDLAVVAPEPCTCGRTTPLLRNIVGRTSDVIVCPGGRLLHGEFFTHLFYGRDEVRQFQVIQESLTIRLVVADGADTEALCARLTEIIHEHGDPALDVRFELLDRIDTSASGKYRFTISKLDRPFG